MNKGQWLSMADPDENGGQEKRKGGAGVRKSNYNSKPYNTINKVDPYDYNLESSIQADDYYKSKSSLKEIQINEEVGRNEYENDLKQFYDETETERVERLLEQFQEINEDNNELLGHSQFLLDLKSASIVPRFVNNVTKTQIYGEFYTDFATNTTVSSSKWKIENPETAFGSYEEYVQGIDLPLRENERGVPLKGGNLENCYVINFTLTQVENSLPFPIGIRVKHVVIDEEKKSETIDYPEQNMCYNNLLMHAIITPGKHDKIEVYKSTVSINNDYGKLYPDYTPFNLKRGVEPYGNSKLMFKFEHPCSKWLMENYINREWSKPKLGSEEDNAGYYIVKKRQGLIALKEVAKIFSDSVPIMNLKTTYFEMISLNSMPVSKSRSGAIKEKRTGGVTFVLNSTHAFKEREITGNSGVFTEEDFKEIESDNSDDDMASTFTGAQVETNYPGRNFY